MHRRAGLAGSGRASWRTPTRSAAASTAAPPGSPRRVARGRRSSSAMNRYPNAGSSRWMSSAALIRCASSQSRSRDRVGLPRVERLLGEAQHPAGHRDRDPVGGKVKDQRVHHFGGDAPGRSTPPPGAGSRSPAPAAGCACAAPAAPPTPAAGHAGTDAVLDVGELQPAVQARLGDPEVLRDLRDRGLALAGDRDHVTAELQRERLRHDEHPSSEDESSQVRSQLNWGQSMLFLSSVSGPTVALALVAQLDRMCDTFLTFALSVLPARLALGLTSYARMADLAVHDAYYARPIGRIRAFHGPIESAAQQYRLLPAAHTQRCAKPDSSHSPDGTTSATQPLRSPPSLGHHPRLHGLSLAPWPPSWPPFRRLAGVPLPARRDALDDGDGVR